jgi:hypothetical protein
MSNEESEIVPTPEWEPSLVEWPRLVLPPFLDENNEKRGDTKELRGEIVQCTKRDRGKFYTPYYPQTWVTSQPLLDESKYEVIKVRLFCNNWHGPNWLEAGGDPKHMNLGGDMGWGRWMSAAVAWKQFGGNVAKVWGAYFFNESDTNTRPALINVVLRRR